MVQASATKKTVDICPECFNYKLQREYNGFSFGPILRELNVCFGQLRDWTDFNIISSNFKPVEARVPCTPATGNRFTAGHWCVLGKV